MPRRITSSIPRELSAADFQALNQEIKLCRLTLLQLHQQYCEPIGISLASLSRYATQVRAGNGPVFESSALAEIQRVTAETLEIVRGLRNG